MKTLGLTIVLLLALLSTNGKAATLKPVTFESQGQTLAGNLYLPDGYTNSQKLPGVVVTGAWTTVKEQMAGTYAAEMADRGYAALAFDFRGWGQSPDVIQYLENPKRKTEDIHAAVNYLATRPEVEAGRIGGLGVCASSGYMSDATLANSHIKALALVAPWLHNADIVKVVYGGEEGVKNLIQMSREAEQSPQPVILEAASLTNDKAVMYQAPYYTETDRGLISEYDNKFNAASWEGWLTYDALQTAEQLKKPTLLVHSEAAAIPQGAHEYARRMDSNVTELWLDDVSQFDFYDAPSPITAASDAVAEHFNAILK
ncbi:MAG: alpha/beta hydrolase [Desulfurellaceae bacterium]|nr:alpha/beta hydrolase [Desulfurellaceae bacterium]